MAEPGLAQKPMLLIKHFCRRLIRKEYKLIWSANDAFTSKAIRGCCTNRFYKSLSREEVEDYKHAEGKRIHAPVLRSLTCCERQFSFCKISFLTLKLMLFRTVLVLLSFTDSFWFYSWTKVASHRHFYLLLCLYNYIKS